MDNLIRRLKRFRHFLYGRELYPAIDRRIPMKRLGSSYGGWFLATQFINSKSIVYSAGIGKDISFDLELIAEKGPVIHAFDPTPASIDWVSKQDLPREFLLHEYGFSNDDKMVDFFPPENPQHISHTLLNRSSNGQTVVSVPVKKLASAMEICGHQSIDLLKMDIEGAEYQVIQNMLKEKIYPSQILVEFHHRFAEVGANYTRRALKLLRQAGYLLYSVSDSGEEYSFIRKALVDHNG